MNWFLILISTFYIPAFAGLADSVTARGHALLTHVVPQDGPNCFNTSLYLQGFSQDLVYTSQTELDFYLENFCSRKAPGRELESRDMVTFANPEDPMQIAHTVVSLNGNVILEKSSLLGSLTPAQEDDPQPGQYLKRDISQSLYSPRSSQILFGSIFKQQAFQCQSEEQVAKKLAAIQKNPAIQEQLLFRRELAKALSLSNRKDLEAKILNLFVPLMAAMKWEKTPVSGALEIGYLQALLRSNAYQMYLFNCSENIKQSGECYSPQLKASITQTEAWFKKIYAFEERNHLNKY